MAKKKKLLNDSSEDKTKNLKQRKICDKLYKTQKKENLLTSFKIGKT